MILALKIIFLFKHDEHTPLPEIITVRAIAWTCLLGSAVILYKLWQTL